MRHALILAGGSGTRLWPYSTFRRPKQLVPMFRGRSLLDAAVERATSVVPSGQVWLGAGEQLRSALTTVHGLRADRLVIEPSGRDTLPAVGLGCAVIAQYDPDAVVAVLTADHLITPVATFGSALESAFRLAESRDDVLVTFGVVPDHAATGFGYLELGEPIEPVARVVTRFREKPSAGLAKQFLEAGPDRYLWNSGMFVWRAQTLLRAVDVFTPQAGMALLELGEAYGTPRWEPLAAVRWPQMTRVSIDYGIMEPASTSSEFLVTALPLTARWLDVGSWPAFGDAVGRDESGNAVSAARAMLEDSRGNVVASSDPDHVIALMGVDGLVVVHTPEATLVVPAARAQDVKGLHGRVAAEYPDRS